MLDAKSIRSLILAAQEEHETKVFINDDDVRQDVAVALVAASGLEAIDLARIGLEPEDVEDVAAWKYFELVSLCYQGGAYSKAFKAMVAAKTVVLVGSGMPPGWHESLEDFLESVDPTDVYELVAANPDLRLVIGTDVDGDEEEDLLGQLMMLGEGVQPFMQPYEAVDGLVRESAPTRQQIAGMCLAFGGTCKGTRLTVQRGFKEVLIDLVPGAIKVNRKPLAMRTYLGGELPDENKALYWALVYAFGGTKGDQVSGRMAYLTQLYAEVDETAEVAGRTEDKYAGSVGILSVGTDASGLVSVKNGVGSDRVKALATCLAQGVAAFPQHQVNSVHAGPGANAMGVGLNGDTVLTNAQADKAEKIGSRVSSSAKKGVPQADGSVTSAFQVVIHG